MAHETIIYGFIEGSTYKQNEYRRLQNLNKKVINHLPTEDEYPSLSRSMFSYPDIPATRGSFRSQVIHFGCSQNGLMFDDVEIWIDKFEKLLGRLYWFEAVAHMWTDYIDGCYTYWWKADDTIIESYGTNNPLTTSKWSKKMLKQTRHMDGPPTNN